MTVTLPSEQGVVDKILDAVQALLTLKLQTEIDTTDASRLVTIKVGPRQDGPESVVVLIHENDPEVPREWPHYPIRYRTIRDSGTTTGMGGLRPIGERSFGQVTQPGGYEMIGGGSRMARCFTLEIEVWGDEVEDVDMERRDVGQIAAIVENRTIKVMKEAGPKIGTGAIIADSFGESVQLGPYWGDAWTDQEEGEALIVRKIVRLWYVTEQSWSTDAW